MNDSSIKEALEASLEDHRLTRSEKRDLAERLRGISGDPQKISLIRHQAFDLVREQLAVADNSDPDQTEQLLEWLEDVVKVLWPREEPGAAGGSEALFSPQDGCASRIIRLFEQARTQVDVCVFTITDDRITDAMLEAQRRGVRIRVISDNDKAGDLGSDIQQLTRRGVAVRVDRSEYHMHHKYALFDARRLLTGSYNWTRSASRYNAENFIVTGDSELVSAFRTDFERLWQSLA